MATKKQIFESATFNAAYIKELQVKNKLLQENLEREVAEKGDNIEALGKAHRHIEQLRDENERLRRGQNVLQAENKRLRAERDDLVAENLQLRQRFGALRPFETVAKEGRDAPKKCLSSFCNNMIYPQDYCEDCQRAWES